MTMEIRTDRKVSRVHTMLAATAAATCLLAWPSAASGDEPLIVIKSLVFTGEGSASISGGPLSDSDSYTVYGDEVGEQYNGHAHVTGSPIVDGSSSASQSGSTSTPYYDSTGGWWSFSAILRTNGNANASPYNSGHPDYITAPTSVSALASGDLSLTFTLNRRSHVSYQSFHVYARSSKYLALGTATTSSVMVLEDGAGDVVSSVEAESAAVEQGIHEWIDDSLSYTTHIFDPGEYFLSMDLSSSSIGTATVEGGGVQLYSQALASAAFRFTPCPEVSISPEFAEVEVGGSVQFTAFRDGVPGGQWTWYRNGIPLDGTEPGISFNCPSCNPNHLWISDANPGHVGSYHAVLDGICGEEATQTATLTVIGAIPGDLNGDGVVNVSDLLILFNHWGDCKNCDLCPADLNGDCTVNVSDLLILFDNWG